EAYHGDTAGTPQELISAARWGYLFQGQHHRWQRRRRGTPAFDLPAISFVHYLENHDQVANSPHGARLSELTSPGRLRALTALLLLSPATPLLFQGQESGAKPPFVFFAALHPDLLGDVTAGRHRFLSRFRSLATPATQAVLPPVGGDTFRRCRLTASDRDPRAVALHRDLLRLRRIDPAFRQQRSDSIHGAVLGPEAFVLRFFHAGGDRLLLVNLGRDLLLAPASEPLLAPPATDGWRILWGSEDVAYGGMGLPAVETEDGWHIPGHAAVVLCQADAA